ncbi:MAG: dioxygenase [Hyphomicrobiales bacterium]|nr:dioxygenase [Hyphomicrobiales bacterium]MDE2018220.1 dioxygenase [Hyphomicrobiales bacterium]
MSKTLPSLFLSHGAPNIVLHPTPAHKFMRAFGEELVAEFDRPKSILVCTAHFETAQPTLTADRKPAMIYDFGGFEPELHRWRYDAPGAPDVAARAVSLLDAAGLHARAVTGRGFDHGTWTPLSLLFPKADIPVAQISVQPQLTGAHHVAMGRALASLRDEGTLIVGSGSATHNLGAFFRGGYKPDSPAPDWVETFAGWVHEKAEAGATDDIAAFETKAPFARENHPTPEHFLPLPFAMGAAGPGAKGKRVHSSHEYGVLVMDAYRFDSAA